MKGKHIIILEFVIIVILVIVSKTKIFKSPSTTSYHFVMMNEKESFNSNFKSYEG